MAPLRVRLRLLGRWLGRRVPWREPSEPAPASRSELWPRLHDLIARQIEPQKHPIAPNSHFIKDLGFDSLDSIELVLSLEEEFGLDIDEDELLEKAQTVGDLLQSLEGRMNHGNRSSG